MKFDCVWVCLLINIYHATIFLSDNFSCGGYNYSQFS